MEELIFLGTGGARVMLARQLLATAGIWMRLGNTRIYLDPGPGALVHAMARNLDLQSLDGIILSHRHLDHCGDANALIEAMTNGGLKQKGLLFAPPDALEEGDPVVLKYLRPYLNGIRALHPMEHYQLGEVSFKTSMPHKHGVTTYGMRFETRERVICYIPDTKYFPELSSFYQGDVLVVSMLRMEPHPYISHLSVTQVEELLSQVRPQLTIITHFGLQIHQLGPENVAREMSRHTGLKIVAAHDGSRFEL